MPAARQEKISRWKFEFENSLFADEIFVRVNGNEQRHEKFVSREPIPGTEALQSLNNRNKFNFSITTYSASEHRLYEKFTAITTPPFHTSSHAFKFTLQLINQQWINQQISHEKASFFSVREICAVPRFLCSIYIQIQGMSCRSRSTIKFLLVIISFKRPFNEKHSNDRFLRIFVK